MSHATAEKALRRAGASEEQIEDVLRDLPDPFDPDSEQVVDRFFKHGLDYGRVTDRMGGSP
jgi:hypothetical protein